MEYTYKEFKHLYSTYNIVNKNHLLAYYATDIVEEVEATNQGKVYKQLKMSQSDFSLMYKWIKPFGQGKVRPKSVEYRHAISDIKSMIELRLICLTH